MGSIKSFRVFEEEINSGLTREQIELLDRCVKGKWKVNPQTGLVDVEGDVNMSDLKVKEIPVNFGQVSEDFYCYRNNLTSLEGVPREVGGSFRCFDNKLTSLVGAPKEVGGHFHCYNNELTSLERAPKEVGGSFDCSWNNLTSLEGAPQEVGAHFYCYDNKLTSLEGAPREVGGSFRCSGNKLTSLEGAPEKFGKKFDCGKFKLEKREWNLEGWLKVAKKGPSEAKSLIYTLLNPEFLNGEIKKNPTGMMMKLKGIWNDGDFREIRDQLVIPDNLKGEMDLLGDMDELGF